MSHSATHSPNGQINGRTALVVQLSTRSGADESEYIRVDDSDDAGSGHVTRDESSTEEDSAEISWDTSNDEATKEMNKRTRVQPPRASKQITELKSNASSKLQKAWDKSGKRILHKGEEAAADFLRSRLPEIKGLDEVKMMLPLKELEGHWSQKLQEQAKKSYYKQGSRRLEKLNPGANTHLLTLMRASLSQLRVSPFDIIAPEFNLAYDWGQARGVASQAGSRVWVPEFCHRLTRIMQHPIWGERDQRVLIARAIQYAVIVETDDRRPVVCYQDAIPGTDVFLRGLFARAAIRPASKTIAEVREDYVNGTDATSRLENRSSSLWNKLFCEIERQFRILGVSHSQAPSIGDMARYKTKTRHLKILERALDGCSMSGWFVFQPLDVIVAGVGSRRPTRAYPRQVDLPDLLDYLLLRAHENKAWVRIMKKKQAESHETSDGSSPSINREEPGNQEPPNLGGDEIAGEGDWSDPEDDMDLDEDNQESSPERSLEHPDDAMDLDAHIYDVEEGEDWDSYWARVDGNHAHEDDETSWNGISDDDIFT